ncbi:DUF6600 domain-containing protein [Pedobacter sp. ASV28]|uniref:DUF6600 domain-containing protein n=1 Tax=Pedobacter sp. ASV28 TaxID=2795123 RepID=UPI0018EDE9D9|nr:DUF6600 domain-containing protein [Pedobacter sp. ASV28]
MKSLIKFPAVALGLFLLLTGATQKAVAQYDDVSLQTFYDELSPYGTWIKDPEYGYVWRPDVDQDEFRPYYTNGRWAMTEYGNTWVSNYDWGWAPFHYGRWIYNRYNRWIWLPDTVWGPAWVSWRSGGGYYGWAPLGPSISININIGRGYAVPDFCWNFIPQRDIYYNSYPRYYSGRNRVYIQNTIIINNTYVRNNRTYYTGPRAEDIRRATNQNVTVYNMSRSNRAGASRIENNSVNIYTPRPTRGNDNANVGPRQVVQGSVTRDRIERNPATNSRSERGNTNGSYPGNMGREERNSNGTVTAPSRGRETTTGSVPNRESRVDNPQTTERDRGVFGRTRDNSTQNPMNDRSSNGREHTTNAPVQQERANRPQQQPQQRSTEGRSQPSAPPQRMERTERSQPQQRPERVEQSSGSGRSSSSGSGESRSSRGESTGRPGRG